MGVIKVGEGLLWSAAVSQTSRSKAGRARGSNFRRYHKVRCCGWLSAQPLAGSLAVWRHGAAADQLSENFANWVVEELVTALGGVRGRNARLRFHNLLWLPRPRGIFRRTHLMPFCVGGNAALKKLGTQTPQ